MCGVTLFKLPLEEQARVSAGLGCTGMGIFHPLVPPTMSTDEIRRILDAHELRATICVPRPFNLLPIAGFSGLTGKRTVQGDGLPLSLDAMIGSLQWLAPLAPDCALVIPGAQGTMSRQEAWDQVQSALVRLCEAADGLGLRRCLEPVHPRFAADFSILSTLDEAMQMVSDVGAPNLGVLIEIFHIWDLADRFEQIARAKGHIFGVQLSDSAAYPRSILDRLPPGDGAADIPALVRAIEATGYRGWYDIEVPSDDGSLGVAAYPDSVWRLPVPEFARRCVDGGIQALRAAGI
jgi:sugar phosphate isomerase/epimerase